MCVSPYIVKCKDGSLVPVPCGHCFDCLEKYKDDWCFRLRQECKQVICPIHLTLTFADEYLPVRYNDEAGEFQSFVSKRDVQLFLKRLRKNFPEFRNNLRYFAIGEYGGKYNRAHYHIIIISSAIKWLHQYDNAFRVCWPDGFIKVTLADNKRIGYVTGYLHKLDDSSHITNPFRLMSKHLGLCFLTEKMIDYFFTTFSCGVKDHHGYWKRLPRYYRKKLDEYSADDYRLRRAGLTFSDVIRFEKYAPKGIERHFDYFVNNYDEIFRDVYREESHRARVNGYSMPDFTHDDINRVFVIWSSSVKDIVDARLTSSLMIENIKVKQINTRLSKLAQQRAIRGPVVQVLYHEKHILKNTCQFLIQYNLKEKGEMFLTFLMNQG